MEKMYEIYASSKGVQTDSRKVLPGELFFALKGENFDGNRYAAGALEAGAVAAVVDDPSVAVDGRYIVVDDTLRALQNLALCHRRKLRCPVLAITGTNGKTTTKELTAAVLSRKFKTYFTLGNLNNHIGVPLTLLAIPPDAEFVIVEMGASAQGEIALLCSIAEPDYGLVTNIGRAHLEGFGGVEGIRNGKGELYDSLARSGGVALYRNDDAVLCEMVAEREGLQSVGYPSTLSEGVRSNLVGDYNGFNIAAAMAVGRYFGVAQKDMLAAISAYTPSNNRSQGVTTERNLLTVDCYNANPSSMAAAILNHRHNSHANYPRKVLILGDMLELGEWSGEEHQRVVDEALGADFEQIILVGDNFASTRHDDPRVATFGKALELKEWLVERPLVGCFVLVKGSRGVGLERVIENL